MAETKQVEPVTLRQFLDYRQYMESRFKHWESNLSSQLEELKQSKVRDGAIICHVTAELKTLHKAIEDLQTSVDCLLQTEREKTSATRRLVNLQKETVAAFIKHLKVVDQRVAALETYVFTPLPMLPTPPKVALEYTFPTDYTQFLLPDADSVTR